MVNKSFGNKHKNPTTFTSPALSWHLITASRLKRHRQRYISSFSVNATRLHHAFRHHLHQAKCAIVWLHCEACYNESIHVVCFPGVWILMSFRLDGACQAATALMASIEYCLWITIIIHININVNFKPILNGAVTFSLPPGCVSFKVLLLDIVQLSLRHQRKRHPRHYIKQSWNVFIKPNNY